MSEPREMFLLFQDQAEFYVVCELCYRTYSHMQWTGSTRGGHRWRERAQAYWEKHEREDGRCEFCDPEIGNGGWVS